MSSITSTSISSYDYLLRNCYSSNRNARKDVGRSVLKKDELINADANALKKVTKNLRDIEYSSDNGTNVYNNVKAFVESYNNLIESTKDTPSKKIENSMKNLKKLVKEYGDELEEIGITISSSGELKMDKETLASCDPKKIKKVLSSSCDLTGDIRKFAISIARYSKALLQTGSSANKSTNSLEQIPGLTEQVNIMSSTSIDVKA